LLGRPLKMVRLLLGLRETNLSQPWRLIG